MPSRTIKRADALRAPELVPGDRDQRDLRRSRSRGRATAALAPRRCGHRACGARSRTSRAISSTGWTHPGLVVDEHHRDDCGARVDRAATTRRGRPRRRQCAAIRSTRKPSRAEPIAPSRAPPCARSPLVTTPSRVESCSTRRPRPRPSLARLSASLPLPVNTTSCGRHPHTAATVSRASSSAVFVARDAGVRTRRVGRMIGEKRCHRRDRLGPHRRGGRVVEVGVDLVGAGRHPSRLGPPPRRSGPGKTPPPDGVVTEDRRSRD